MDGLIGGVGSTWGWLGMSTSATYVATSVLLVMFLALHVYAVQMVVRPLTRPANTPRTRSGERRTRATGGRKAQLLGPSLVTVRFAASTRPCHVPGRRGRGTLSQNDARRGSVARRPSALRVVGGVRSDGPGHPRPHDRV